ncbi:MAG: hypothetical protein ACRDTD_17380 [Pseudonocardiaceae bacterium]
MRRALDQALEQASDAQRERFFAALATGHGTHPVVHLTTAMLEPVELLHQEELLAHLRAQWHLLVKTDNLLGPRYALSGVLLQLQLLEELLISAPASARTEFVALAAQYAESAAWLYEDSGDLAAAQTYNSRAMEWAHEAGAREALQIALGVGSQRTVHEVRAVGRQLTSYRYLAPVRQLLDELAMAAAL